MACRFTELIIDCIAPPTLARFWAQVLGSEIIEEGDDEVVVAAPLGFGPNLLFLQVPEPKTTKNRLHIDLNATDRDQAAEVERIKALGATEVDIGQGTQTWVVLADPEGNEFCVLRTTVEPASPT